MAIRHSITPARIAYQPAIMSQKGAYRAWMFTINNPTPCPTDKPKTWPGTSGGVYQKELAPLTGTLHLQGYVVFTKPKRLAALKRIHAKAHWEMRMGTHEQAVTYCTKDETRLDGATPKSWGSYCGKDFVLQQAKVTGLEKAKAILDAGGTVDEVSQEAFGTWLRYKNSLNDYVLMLSGPRDTKTKVIILWGETGTGKRYVNCTKNLVSN